MAENHGYSFTAFKGAQPLADSQKGILGAYNNPKACREKQRETSLGKQVLLNAEEFRNKVPGKQEILREERRKSNLSWVEFYAQCEEEHKS